MIKGHRGQKGTIPRGPPCRRRSPANPCPPRVERLVGKEATEDHLLDPAARTSSWRSLRSLARHAGPSDDFLVGRRQLQWPDVQDHLVYGPGKPIINRLVVV